MSKILISIMLLTGLSLVGAGCLEQTPEPATVIGQSEALVLMEIATEAPDEPVTKTAMAMPCLRFKNRAGFLSWANNYAQGQEPMAKDMALNIGLAENADLNLTEYLTSSVPENSEFVGLCVIHKQLKLATWGAESAEATSIYTYYNGSLTSLKLKSPNGDQPAHCLPSTITDSEMIWKCETVNDTWQQIHINRKSGEMKAIECHQNNPGQGCLQ